MIDLRYRGALAAFVVAAVLVSSLVAAAAAVAATPPTIEGESATNVGSTAATLDAQINLHEAPDGVYYQFQLASSQTEFGSEILCPPTLQPGYTGCNGPQGSGALPIGFLPGHTLQPSATSPASTDLERNGWTLRPGTKYYYRVLAARAVQNGGVIEWEPPTVFGSDQTFTTLPEPQETSPIASPSPASSNGLAEPSPAVGHRRCIRAKRRSGQHHLYRKSRANRHRCAGLRHAGWQAAHLPIPQAVYGGSRHRRS